MARGIYYDGEDFLLFDEAIKHGYDEAAFNFLFIEEMGSVVFAFNTNLVRYLKGSFVASDVTICSGLSDENNKGTPSLTGVAFNGKHLFTVHLSVIDGKPSPIMSPMPLDRPFHLFTKDDKISNHVALLALKDQFGYEGDLTVHEYLDLAEKKLYLNIRTWSKVMTKQDLMNTYLSQKGKDSFIFNL